MVRHAGGSYAVIVRAGACADVPALLAERHPGARVAVIADATVAATLTSPCPTAEHFTFAAGERHKSRESWSALTDRLLAQRYDRNTVIVAFGGGVTTDLAGFVAATYLRGLPWIAVPTTTLAMLDAAIGGKTGVDTPAGKNLVGAFHPPSAVICDPGMLTTLPARGYREGLAEAIKHGVTLDARYGIWIGDRAPAIVARQSADLEWLIQRSVELKAAVVMEDEHEGNRRAVLNAGHTVAHAIERATDYAVPHGEAVAIGLVLETLVAERMGVADHGTADQVAALLSKVGLPTRPPPGVDRDRMMHAMLSDKKNRDGVVHASLLARFGQIARHGDSWTRPLDLAILHTILAEIAVEES